MYEYTYEYPYTYHFDKLGFPARLPALQTSPIRFRKVAAAPRPP